jgi:RNA polymerase sigma-70 factor, ECF subfamily
MVQMIKLKSKALQFSEWRKQMAIRGGSSTLMMIPLPLDSDVGKLDGVVSSQRTASMVAETSGPFDEAAGRAASPRDQDLVFAARTGCRAAFNELWTLYSRRVYGTIFNIVKNPQDTEDALQDAFLRAFLALETFEGRASFYTWLTRIAINSALGILRKRRCRPESSLDSISRQDAEWTPEDFKDSAPNPECTFDQQQRREKLQQAINKLPTNLREAVEELIAEDSSVKEIAYRLNISQSAVKSRLYRARTRLIRLTAHHGSKTRTTVSHRSEASTG